MKLRIVEVDDTRFDSDVVLEERVAERRVRGLPEIEIEHFFSNLGQSAHILTDDLLTVVEHRVLSLLDVNLTVGVLRRL